MRTFKVFLAAVLASLIVPEMIALFLDWKVSYPNPIGLAWSVFVTGGYMSACAAGLWLAIRSDHQSQGWLWFGGILAGCGMGIISGAISSLIFEHKLDDALVLMFFVFGAICGLGVCSVLHFLAPSTRETT